MNVLLPDAQVKVEEKLVTDGTLSKSDLKHLKAEAHKANEPLMSYLLQKKVINDEDLTRSLAEISNVPYVNLQNARIDPKFLSFLPQDAAQQYMAVPIGEMQNKVAIAMLDADNVQAVDFLSNKIGRPLKVYAASETGILSAIGQYGSSGLEHGVSSILENTVAKDDDTTEQKTLSTKDANQVQTIVQDSPISKALRAILEYAGNNRASDVHIESMEKELKVRCRVDGVLRELMRLPKNTEAPLISRIKILSNLKIDEHRIPQDGQFTVTVGRKEIDIRVAISPVVWGEQVVMRLLDKTSTNLHLEDMGYIGRSLRMIRKGIKLPHGMLLTSGPTGSGKTSSMYAMIQEIKNDSINIVTLEDPVEYKMDGVNQIQINPGVGLTFATGLRSVLRQDPDVVMVGEIRDKETANLAVQAALTGHLVFSTLHTNSAAGILPRLLDMGIEPFLIASTVHTVIGQRLVRRAIPGGELYKSTAVETEAIKSIIGNLLPKTKAESAKIGEDLGYQNLPLATQNAYTLVKGKTTPDSPDGYQGRMGLYEVFEVTEQIQDLILKRAPSNTIKQMAQSQGMISMKQDGYFKALSGMTTLLEVNRVASGEG